MNGNAVSSDLRVISKLGEGSFAEVFKVKNPKTQQIFAVKRLKKRYRTIDEVNKLPEVLYLRALQGHPNIIKLYEVMFDNSSGFVALRFELMDKNLYELLRDNQKPFDEKTSLLLIYQLLKALEFMHSKNLFHRDVKPENCMVNKATLELKLCDFGSTRQTSTSGPYTEYVSTRWYRAPECILTSGSYGPEVDIWAVGCMLYELVTSRPLFPGKHEIDQISRIHNVVGTPSRDVLAKFRQNPNPQISFSFPQRYPQDLHKLLPTMTQDTIDLLGKLLIYNPSDRITAHEALEHPAFEMFRAADARWVAAGCKVPFSVFFQQNGQVAAAPTRTSHNQPFNPAPSAGYGSYVLESDSLKPKEQPLLISNQQILPPIHKPKQPLIDKPHPTIQPQVKPKVNLSIEFNAYEARKRAAQRIREYNQKKLMSQKHNTIKATVPQAFHFGAPNITKPYQPYQKPRPELIQPRLPHIAPYFH